VRDDERFSNLETIAQLSEIMTNTNKYDDERFSDLETIAQLSEIMANTNKYERYPMFYRLLKLVLVLPVATATIERCFLSMQIVKIELHNWFGDIYEQ
jgi:hypothetical protein